MMWRATGRLVVGTSSDAAGGVYWMKTPVPGAFCTRP
jgi:hypothetical protein